MNHVSLMGNLTRDPEVRYTPKGMAVCEFTIAATKRWRTEAGEEKERTAFIGCVCWGKRGEAFAQYHRKGQRALVEGELVQETWEDKESGKKREKTKVEVASWHFVNAKADRGEDAPAARPAPAPRTAQAAQPAPAASNPPPEDDDGPF